MPPKKATTGGTWSWQQDDTTYAAFDAKAGNIVELAYASTNTGTGVVAAKNNGWDYEYDFDAMTQKNTSTGRVRAIQRAGPPLPAVAAAAAASAAAAAAAHAAKLAADAAAAHAAALQAAADAAATAAGVAAVAATTPAPAAGGVDEEDAAPATTAAPAPPTGPVSWAWENDRGEFEAFDAAVAKIVEDAYEIEEGAGKTKREANGFRYEYDFDAMTQRNISSGRVRKLQRSIGGVVVAPAAAKAVVAKSARDDDGEGEPALKRVRADDGTAVEPPTPAVAKSTAAALAAIGAVAVTSAGGKSVHMTSSGTHGHMQIIKKGRGVVDTHSGLAATSHVLEAGPIVYQCMLNQTNVSANNNKFYVIQVIEKDDKSCVYCFTRWGRVGVPGATNLDAFGSTFAAIQSFEKKFREKTKNAWSSCATDHTKFVKYDGAYQLMAMDLADDQDDAATPAAAAAAAAGPAAACTLPPELQRVMRVISNKTVMEGAMRELKIDTRRMPLGKISKAQIKAAYKHLQSISEELVKKKPSGSVIESNTSMFYTLVPHDFGMTRPPLIDDEDTLKRKMDMLDLLAELEIATTLIAAGSSSKDHPMDSAYRSLKCPLQVVPHASAVFDRVRRYVKNTHGGTHKNYTLAVENVFEVDRPGELSRFRAGKYDALEPRMMLWHGSRSANFMGILSQGLRIAPPEAPVTGYMYGKGVYFADCSSKSANYCHASPTGSEAFLLLCEVAIGTRKEFAAAEYMDEARPGTHSTMGVGRYEPDTSAYEKDEDGVVWPLAPLKDTGRKSALLYNEFIVYDTAQLRMRYMVHLKFNFK